MNKARGNGKKTNFGPDFGLFDPNLSQESFFPGLYFY